jgi:hypothetical protein
MHVLNITILIYLMSFTRPVMTETSKDPFLEKLAQQIKNNLNTAVQICSKRLNFETKNMNTNNSNFLLELINTCMSNESLIQSMPHEQKKDINASIEKILYATLTDIKFSNTILTKTCLETTYKMNRKSFSQIVPLATEKISSLIAENDDIGDLYETIETFASSLESYAFLDQAIKIRQLMTFYAEKTNQEKKQMTQQSSIARIYSILGKNIQSKQILLKLNKKMANNPDYGIMYFINLLDLVVVYRELNQIEHSISSIKIAEKLLKIEDYKKYFGWYYLEKSELEFRRGNTNKAFELIRLARSQYKEFNPRDQMFTYIKEAEFLRKLKKSNDAQQALKNAQAFTKYFHDSPFYTYYFLYESALNSFINKNISDLKKTLSKMNDLLEQSPHQEQFLSLVLPLKTALTEKDAKSRSVKLSLLIKNKNNYFSNYYRSTEIDNLLREYEQK